MLLVFVTNVDIKQRICMTMMPILGQQTVRKMRHTKSELNRTIVFNASSVMKLLHSREN